VLDAALYEWEERMSADNITVLVVEFEWNEDGGVAPVAMEQATAAAFRQVARAGTDVSCCNRQKPGWVCGMTLASTDHLQAIPV
jgi:hypothetical protein